MNQTIRFIIDRFERINRIPRCSKQERQLSEWLRQWAAERNLAARSDAAGNLVIRVPASEGCEQAPTVVLQGHMDMVCEKRADSDHDFTRDPIAMVHDGDWLTARETTLGADNGIAIALALTLAERPEVTHPPLELFFTVEEETGLTGAMQMDPSLLTGRILINLDAEDEGGFVVGCAGGRATTIERPLDRQPLADGYEGLRICVEGLQGGHSGVDIAKHRANANTVVARLLGGTTAAGGRLLELDGGTARNVIPRAGTARIACRRDRVEGLAHAILELAETIRREHRTTEPDLTVRLDRQGPIPAGSPAVTERDTAVVVDLLRALPSGPLEMAVDDPLRVQTSVNLAIARIVETGALAVVSSQRSAAPSRLDAVCQAVEATARLAGARAVTDPGYPSWPMDPESRLLARCTALYRKLFGVEPTVQVMHAGLECGVIGDRCPGMDMISLGPTIENPHSPSERLHVPSVGKVWTFLAALLASFKD